MTSDELDRLQAAFPASPPAPVVRGAPPSGGITADFEAKHRRLGARWSNALNTVGAFDSYVSASEGDLAIVDALVKRNFTDAEIWQLLKDSPRYQDRVRRKGQAHADKLFETEIGKARSQVVPFPPETPERRRAGRHPRPAPAGHGEAQPTPVAITPPAARRLPLFTVVTPPESFITHYIEYAALRTDAPHEAHELMAVGAMSALAGPGPRLPIATAVTGWRLALWVLFIANTTHSRKSTVLYLIQDIIEEVLGEEATLSWEGSPQGFIQKLQARDGQASVFMRDEYSGLMIQVNRGGHMAGLAQTFIRAYDGGRLENIRTRKRDKETGRAQSDTDRVLDPYLVKLTAAARDHFVESATINNVRDGFLARFIFVEGQATPERLKQITGEITRRREALVAHAREFVRRAGQFEYLVIPPDTLDAMWETEQAWLAEAEQTEFPSSVAASFKRLADSTLKVAGLLAIDADSLTVELAHYQVALAMAERWRRSNQAVIESLGATEFRRNCDALSATIAAKPGISVSEIYRHHRSLRKRDFEEALDALAQQELVVAQERESSGGRRALCYWAVAPEERPP